MKRFMPKTWRGRAVRIQKCSVRKGDGHGRRKGNKHRALWLLILSKRGDGDWWSVSGSWTWSEYRLIRARDAMRRRATRAKICSLDLFVTVTVVEGLVFHWRMNAQLDNRRPDV